MKKPRRPSRVRPQFHIEELEPRLLFSADPLLAAAAGAPCVVTMPQAPEQAAAANAGAFAQTADSTCATAEAPAITQAPREIAFVDLSVDGAQDLIAALAQQQADGRQIEIVTIAAGEDGLAVITRTLAERQDVDAVHLFSHGDAAGLQLGSLRLDAASLHARLGEIAGWAGAFSEQGDLLLYGCNLAGSPAGIALIDSLSLLTGADVAGSTNLTGSAAQGGDWTLEYTAGRIDTALAMNASLLGDWDQVLATATYQDGVGGYTGTTDTFLDQLSASNNSASTTLSAGRATTQNGFQTLIKFENIIGVGAGQIPPGAIITNVTLTVQMTASPTFTNPTFSLYRMLANWSDTATWSSMGDGVNGGEARGSADQTITDSGAKSYTFASNAAMIASVQAWANDPSSNQGWYIFCDDNSSKASFASAENGTVAFRPKLTVEYVIPSPPGMDLDANNSSGAAGNNYQGGFTEGGGAVRVADTDATITAGSTGTMTGMTVTLNNRPNGASELLAATTTGTPIVASYNSGTGMLTLSGSATLAQYQQVLRTVTYNNTSQNPDTAGRSLTVVLTDAFGQTASATSAISVTAVNNAPTVATTGTALGYTENAGAVVVDGGVTVADVDNTQLTGATVQLTTNYVNGQDTLSFTDQNGITGVWDAATGTLTLSGTATVAQYQAALRSVTYTNNSEAPSTSARTVRFLVNDGALSSAAATRSITVASVNDAPVATITPTSYSATEQTNLALQGTGLSISDVDAGSASVQATLSVTSGVLTVLAGSSGVTVTNSGTAAVTLTGTLAQINALLAGTGGATITYLQSSNTPPASATLTLGVNDQGNTGTGGARTGSDTATINITAVNDAPTATITPTSYSATEQVNLTLHGTGLSIADVDAGSSSVQATLSVTAGILTVAAGSTGVVVSGSGTGTVTLTGTLTQINNLLAGLNSGTVTYVMNSDTPPASATLTLGVNDQGNSGSGGPLTASDTATINITAVNDAPTATITPTSYSATEQINLTLQGTGLSIADVDAGSASVQATLSVTAGILTVAAGSTGVVVSGSGTGTVTLTGTLAQINNLLAGLNSATVTYVMNSDAPPASATLTLGVNDQGNTGTGGARTGSDTATINLTAVNDAPTATITPTSYSATEQVNLTLHGTGLSIADVDAGSSSVQATLSVTAGILTVAAGSTGVVVSGSGSGTVTLTGTLAQINNLLAGLNSGTITYVMNSDTPPASATLTLGVNDQGNTGTGGPLTAGDTATINITAVNDAPTATITPTSYSATEQINLTLQGTGLSIADVDAGSASVQATLSVTAGILTVAAGSTGVVVSGSGSGTVTLTGTLAQINNLLAGLNSGTVTYVMNNDAPPASATLTLGVNDQGNTGTGGARTGSDTATINITAVNDAPTATITPTSYSATEQLNLTLHGTGLSIADVDAGSASVQATLSVTAGILTVAAGSTGVVVSGSGSGTVTLTGTLAQINNLLAGLNSGTVTYVMNSDTPPASDTLTLGVNDQGNTGTGGPLTASDTATINITAVNDAPTATITPTSYSATEQVLLALQGTGLSVSDPDAGSSVVSVSVSVASGTLQAAAGSTGVVISGTGTGTVTLTGTLAQINALLAGSGGATLDFTHTSDAPPASTVLTLAINDQGNTGTGGARSGSDTATINITPVNDAPAIVTNLGTSVSQGLQVVLTNIRLRATDPDHTAGQLTYTLTATVSNGVLTRNGVALGLGDTFTQADLDSGLVAYTHDNSVTFSDQFEFAVTDPDGGTTGNTAFAITVTSVNTPPTLATNLPATVLEGQSTVITSALLSTQDAEEAANDLVYTLASLPAHGQLLLNGVALGSGDSFTQQDINNGLLSYEHDGSETLGDTFDFTVEDGRGGVIGNTTFALNVTPVNDAPTANVNDGTVAEGGSLTIGSSLLQSSDADHAVGSLTLTLQAEPTHGVLRLNGTVLQVGDTFTQADIDAGHLVYEHAGGEGAADQFLFSVSDGLASSGNLAIDLVITPVNDAPQAVITQPSYNVAEQQVLLLHGTGLSVGDVDAGASQVQVTLSVVSGVLSVVTGGSGVLVAGSGTNSLVLTGSVADINALLAGLNGAALHYQVNSNTPPASDTLTLAIDDLGHTGAGGALTASDSVAINITAVNDAPIAVITPPAYSATEQLPLALQGTGLSVSDPDAGNSSVQATLTVAFGTLTAQAGSTGVVVAGSGTGSITLTGTLAQINALLAGTGGATLSYLVATDTPPATDTLTLAINDLGNTGTGGALTGSDSALINITAVNDAPTATITSPSYAATEQVPLPLHGTGLTVSDPDGGSTTVVATVSVVSGQLNVSAGGSGVAVSGSGTSTVTLTGTIAQINALLSGINGATLNYLANADTPSASDTLTLLLDDQGNGGSGGPLTASDTALINITAVNDAPVATAPPSYSATEQTPLALQGTGLSVSDADAGSSTVQATLSVAFGTLSVNAGSTGVAVAGSDTGSLTLTGTVAQINALLAGNGGATVSYLINGDAPPAADTLTLAIDDQGHAGIGGALNDTATATIAITAVNDAPTASITVPAYAATEQVPLTLHGTGLSIGDVDAGNSIVQATLSVVSGTLTVGPGSTGVAVAGSGTGSVTLTGTIAQINALLAGSGSASVTYVLGSDTPPASDTLTLLVNDMGHEGIGGVLTASDTALISITTVNDAPVATAPPSYSATEQTPLALQGTGLSVSDADAGSSTVQATLSVAFGTLSVNAGSTGVAVAGSDTGSLTLTGTVAQINALLAGNGGATVSYLINGDAPPAADTLTLAIDDQGHAGIGGALNDTATATIAITAVNDAPTASITVPAYAATEQVPLTLHGTGLSIGDVDAGNSIVQATLSVVSGTLTVGPGSTGVAVAGSGTGSVTLTGTIAQINALLAGSGSASVTYVLGSDTPPASDTLTLLVNDMGHEGIGGVLTASDTALINITAVNDAPVATAPPSYSATEQTPLALQGTGLSVSDADAGSSTVQATLSVAFGTLTVNAGSTGVVVAGSGTGSLTLTGTVAQINALLAGNGGATVSYLINGDTPPAADTLSLTMTDGVLASSATSTLHITAVNDAPVVTITQPAYAATEQIPLALQGTGLSVSDVDAGNGLVRVLLAVDAGSLFVGVGATGVTAAGSGGSLVVLTGSLAQINQLLAGMGGATVSYVIDSDTPPALDQLTLAISDLGGSGSGGAQFSQRAVNIVLTAVHDDPRASDDQYSTPPSTPLTLTPGMLLGNDVSPEGMALTLSIVGSPLHGTLTVRPDGSLFYQPVAGFIGTDTFRYVVNDGVAGSNVATVSITVQAPPAGGGPTLPGDSGSTTPTAPGIDNPGGGSGTTPPGNGTGGSSGEGGESPGSGSNDSTPGPEAGAGDPTGPGAGAGDDAIVIAPGAGSGGNGSASGQGRGGLQAGYALASPYVLTGLSFNMSPLDLKIQVSRALDVGTLVPVQLTLNDNASLLADGLKLLREDTESGQLPLVQLSAAQLQTVGSMLSIGAVWWAARGATLLTSLLVTTPIWRTMDPLPVLSSGGPDDDDDGSAFGEDGEAERMFEEPPAADPAHADIG